MGRTHPVDAGRGDAMDGIARAARSATRWTLHSELLAALCFALYPLAPASASPLPAAQYSVQLNHGTPISVPGSFSQGGEIGEIAGFPAPLVHAHVGGSGTSVVELRYYFRVDGPDANLPVPIHVTGRVRISAGNAVFRKGMIWGVTAQLIAQSFDGPIGPGVGQIDSQFSSVDCNPVSVGDVPVSPPIPTCAATEQERQVVLALNTVTGADNLIAMNAAANNQETFAADFDSLVDPVISFAPEFDATGYTITLSEGVGNASIPEPGTAFLMGPAIGLLLRRRRKRQPSGSL